MAHIMAYDYLFVFLVAFVGVFNLTPLMIWIANRTNFMDNPEARKMQKKAVPLLGGLAVFIGFAALVAYDVFISRDKTFDTRLIGFLAGAVIIVTVGLIDDRKAMRPLTKMLGQIISVLVFISLNNLFYLFGSPFISVPLQLLWMVGLMNAFNYLDNMDGILAGMSGVLALGFFALSQLGATPALGAETHFISLLSLTFAGAVLGFLPQNFNPAKIFMGDTGSMFIGYFLGAVGILTGHMAVVRQQSMFFWLVPVLLLSYAIFDISLVSYIRNRDGRHVLQGGKDHSTHRIGNATGSIKTTAIIIYCINALIATLTVLVFNSGNRWLLLGTTALFVLSFILFGKRLDAIPVVITTNQIKQQTGE